MWLFPPHTPRPGDASWGMVAWSTGDVDTPADCSAHISLLRVHHAGTIGHVAHGKSTVVKAISGVQTVRFKNELERNITIKLGYANAKIFKCKDVRCPRYMSASTPSD